MFSVTYKVLTLSFIKLNNEEAPSFRANMTLISLILTWTDLPIYENVQKMRAIALLLLLLILCVETVEVSYTYLILTRQRSSKHTTSPADPPRNGRFITVKQMAKLLTASMNNDTSRNVALRCDGGFSPRRIPTPLITSVSVPCFTDKLLAAPLVP